MFAVIKMWYKNIAGRFFGLIIKHTCDGRTDGQNYDSQDHASIAVSRGNNNHWGTVSIAYLHASVFMIYNGSEFAVYHYTTSAKQ